MQIQLLEVMFVFALTACTHPGGQPAVTTQVPYYTDCVALADRAAVVEQQFGFTLEAWAQAGEARAQATGAYATDAWPPDVPEPDFSGLPASAELSLAWPSLLDVATVCRAPSGDAADVLLSAEIDVTLSLPALGLDARPARLRRSIHSGRAEELTFSASVNRGEAPWLPAETEAVTLSARGDRDAEGRWVGGTLEGTATLLTDAGGEGGSFTLWAW